MATITLTRPFFIGGHIYPAGTSVIVHPLPKNVVLPRDGYITEDAVVTKVGPKADKNTEAGREKGGAAPAPDTKSEPVALSELGKTVSAVAPMMGDVEAKAKK